MESSNSKKKAQPLKYRARKQKVCWCDIDSDDESKSYSSSGSVCLEANTKQIVVLVNRLSDGPRMTHTTCKQL